MLFKILLGLIIINTGLYSTGIGPEYVECVGEYPNHKFDHCDSDPAYVRISVDTTHKDLGMPAYVECVSKYPSYEFDHPDSDLAYVGLPSRIDRPITIYSDPNSPAYLDLLKIRIYQLISDAYNICMLGKNPRFEQVEAVCLEILRDAPCSDNGALHTIAATTSAFLEYLQQNPDIVNELDSILSARFSESSFQRVEKYNIAMFLQKHNLLFNPIRKLTYYISHNQSSSGSVNTTLSGPDIGKIARKLCSDPSYTDSHVGLPKSSTWPSLPKSSLVWLSILNPHTSIAELSNELRQMSIPKKNSLRKKCFEYLSHASLDELERIPLPYLRILAFDCYLLQKQGEKETDTIEFNSKLLATMIQAKSLYCYNEGKICESHNKMSPLFVARNIQVLIAYGITSSDPSRARALGKINELTHLLDQINWRSYPPGQRLISDTNCACGNARYTGRIVNQYINFITSYNPNHEQIWLQVMHYIAGFQIMHPDILDPDILDRRIQNAMKLPFLGLWLNEIWPLNQDKPACDFIDVDSMVERLNYLSTNSIQCANNADHAIVLQDVVIYMLNRSQLSEQGSPLKRFILNPESSVPTVSELLVNLGQIAQVHQNLDVLLMKMPAIYTITLGYLLKKYMDLRHFPTND